MRFLIISQFFPPEIGAAPTRLALFARELKRQGHEVEVVTAFPNYPEGKIHPGYSGRAKTETWEGVKVHRFWLYAANGKGLGRLMNYLSFAISAIGGIHRVQKPDWIFVNTGPLFVIWPAWIYSLVWKAPIVLAVADLWPRSVQHLQGVGAKLGLKLAEFLEAWAYARSRSIAAVTEGIKTVLVREKGIAEGKVLFLPNGIDLRAGANPQQVEMLRTRLGLAGKFVLVYPGNHGHAHALHRVLEAAAVLQDKASRVVILLVGGGSEKVRLQQMASSMNLKNVLFEGPVPASELADWIALADLGLVHLRDTPLAEETRPAKLFPLMAGGKAVIYCGGGEGARLIQEAKAGWVLPPERPDMLVNKIYEILGQKNQISELSQNSRKYAQEHFAIEAIVANWLQALPTEVQ